MQVVGTSCFYHADEYAELDLLATLLDGQDPVAAAELLLVYRDDAGERVVAQATTGPDGKASFALETTALARKSELYVVFEGTEEDGAWTLLPAQSDAVGVYGVAHRPVTYEAGCGTNTAYNPEMLTSLSDVADLMPSLRRGFTFAKCSTPRESRWYRSVPSRSNPATPLV